MAGLRNPAGVVGWWPALRATMAPVRDALCRLRQARPALRQVHLACGDSPGRPPPAEEDVAAARHAMGEALGLPIALADAHHAASPLRYELFRALAKRASDSDTEVAGWLQHGAPMGIRRPVVAGGLFPRSDRPPEEDAEHFMGTFDFKGNHPSFSRTWGESEPPTTALVQAYVEKGFGKIFRTRQDAENFLGAQCFPAPLGNVSKPRKGGGWKHRIIQDLRICHINGASGTFERTVLPRAIEHGVDLADMAALGPYVFALVLDLEDAFMTVPLHVDEQPFNCAEVPGIGFIVWQVLGFGGKANPLVFGRVGSFAARYGQALLDPVRARHQLYVDDPAVVVAGELEELHVETDLLLTFWLALGFRLSWKKGAFVQAICTESTRVVEPVRAGPIDEQDALKHEWIGVLFALRGQVALMGLTTDYVNSTRQALAPFLRRSGSASMAQARSAIGKAARVAQVVPAATPFVASLWAALAGAQRAAADGRAEAPPGSVAVVRFFTAAAWMDALLRPLPRPESEVLFPLCRRVYLRGAAPATQMSPYRVEFDASPWGGGALLAKGDRLCEHFTIEWDDALFQQFGAIRGNPRWQSLWELVTLLLALIVWGDNAVDCCLMVLGDNVSALQDALSLKGKGDMNHVAREISWRAARFRWIYDVQHLPSELNRVADALSRQFAVPPLPLPAEVARDSSIPRVPPPWSAVWLAWVDKPPVPDTSSGA